MNFINFFQNSPAIRRPDNALSMTRSSLSLLRWTWWPMENARSNPVTNDLLSVFEGIRSFPSPQTHSAALKRSKCNECCTFVSSWCLRCALHCPRRVQEGFQSARRHTAQEGSSKRFHHQTTLLNCCKLSQKAAWRCEEIWWW